MTKDEQLAIFDEYAGRALEMVLEDLATNAPRVLRKARQRFEDGADVFGDRMFRRHPTILYADEVEEVADAVAYRVAGMWQRERDMVWGQPLG